MREWFLQPNVDSDYKSKIKSTTNARLGLILYVIWNQIITTTRWVHDKSGNIHWPPQRPYSMSPWTWPPHALHPTPMLSFHPYGWNMQDNWWELMDEDLFAIHLLCPKVASYHLKVIVDTYNITMRESFSILIHTLHL